MKSVIEIRTPILNNEREACKGTIDHTYSLFTNKAIDLVQTNLSFYYSRHYIVEEYTNSDSLLLWYDMYKKLNISVYSSFDYHKV